MQLLPLTGRTGFSRALTFMFVVSLVIVLGASCGSDDSGFDQVTSTGSGANGDSLSDDVATNDEQAEPVATTAPISSTAESAGASGDGDEVVTAAPTTTDAAADDGSAATGIDVSVLQRNFGANDTVCASVLIPPLAAPDDAQAATACLLAEIAAARPVVLDYELTSTEGDPIFYRYVFDGTQTLVVNDSRLDAFGSQTVVAQICQSIESGPLVPIPSECTPATSTGIAEAD